MACTGAAAGLFLVIINGSSNGLRLFTQNYISLKPSFFDTKLISECIIYCTIFLKGVNCGYDFHGQANDPATTGAN